MGVKIAINGAGGRMGRRLMALCSADAGLDLAAALEYDGCPLNGRAVSEIEPEVKNGGEVKFTPGLECAVDAMIDFSTPEGTVARVKEAAEKGVALVIGTTGMDKEQLAAVAEAAKKVPVIHAANYSLGVNLLVKVAGEVAKALGEDFDIEITEAHHNKKVDAPSGTALAIAQSICDSTNRDMDKDLVHGRSGRPGARTKKEIGMHAIRMGSVVGDHTAHFGSEFEIVELSHRAQTRDVFAAGALRAAGWLAGKEPGMYSMQDVLFG